MKSNAPFVTATLPSPRPSMISSLTDRKLVSDNFLAEVEHVFESQSSISSLLSGGSPPRRNIFRAKGAQGRSLRQVSMHKRMESEIEMPGRRAVLEFRQVQQSENWDPQI